VREGVVREGVVFERIDSVIMEEEPDCNPSLSF
jgi:hypothetical protein